MSEEITKGKLEVIFGPVYSGKTSELIKRITRYFLAGYKCLVIGYSTQSPNALGTVMSHNGFELPALLTSSLQSAEVQSWAADFDVIGIDEGHKFTDITEFCINASDNGKMVIVAAQDSNFERQGYPHILNLVPVAENVNKLTSICMSKPCRNDAPFTKKLLENYSEAVQEVIPKNIPVCQDCL